LARILLCPGLPVCERARKPVTRIYSVRPPRQPRSRSVPCPCPTVYWVRVARPDHSDSVSAGRRACSAVHICNPADSSNRCESCTMSAVVVTSPTPRRVRAPKWLDLRLGAGVVLVLASVLLGARVISSATASDSVWAVSRDLAPGTVLSAGDLSEVHVRLPAGADAYLPVHTVVLGQSVTRPVTAGELLPRAALAATNAPNTVKGPLACHTCT